MGVLGIARKLIETSKAEQPHPVDDTIRGSPGLRWTKQLSLALITLRVTVWQVKYLQ